jgi:hypothetical protein
LNKIFAASLVLACSAAQGSQGTVISSYAPFPPAKIVSVEQSDKNWIVTTEKKYNDFNAYVKWEFNCTDATVRYLGSSNSATVFKAEQQDKDFSKASDDISTKRLFREVCKPAPMSVTSSQ